MKKNKLLLLFGLLLTVSCAYGQGEYPTSLVIKRLESKPTQVFYLHQLHKITFEAGKMHVTMQNGWSLPENGIFPLKQIEKCTFSTELPTTDNEAIVPNEGVYSCYEEEDRLKFNGLDAQTSYNLRIFNVSGSLIYTAKQFQSSQSIDTSLWSAGVYLISINNQPIKFVKQ
ncbi:T9SS type A sorting domain-containing protein [Porphyromonas gingivicanis]|uniref:T9SS type A sorting domain-containing protein n=1 Tax=Porphyromonas gingivicanis TaxID=266762 RepID=UPI0009DED129|nr:T9SS type A sorting domain-containing protein [Porphyromonas gingivicanis]